MKMEKVNAGTAIHGHVKWFDPRKDFGFVVAADGGPDILLHGNILRDYGRTSVRNGAQIEMHIRKGSHGLQVEEILKISIPDDLDDDPAADDHMPEAVDFSEIPLSPVRIKWYNDDKGFGFAQEFGNSDDIFIHNRLLLQAGLTTLDAGDAIGLRYTNNGKGKVALQILPWS